MKCALELVAIATVKADEIARAKAEQERVERERTRTRTIAFCERLGMELEAMAEAGKSPTISFHCSSLDHVLTATHSDYADGRKSYRANCFPISLHDLCDWFADYCFNVETEVFHYYQYGWGYCAGKTVTISPAPVCLA